MYAVIEETRIDLKRWWEYGACVGSPTEWWFPLHDPRRVRRETAESLKARALCATCRVRQECLADGMTPLRHITSIGRPAGGSLPTGIYGGLDERERNQLLGHKIKLRVLER